MWGAPLVGCKPIVIDNLDATIYRQGITLIWVKENLKYGKIGVGKLVISKSSVDKLAKEKIICEKTHLKKALKVVWLLKALCTIEFSDLLLLRFEKDTKMDFILILLEREIDIPKQYIWSIQTSV